ncbi:MAG: hypothetical protein B7Y90_13910 [Alphaproteobacteria bacterium 32-64-14]|nr:MAG: hypothetical protein B7Y90_13910 [Alphaproteobacteria bacterium 32-64-14]
MKYADALKLKPGDRVQCRDHYMSQRATQWWSGEVRAVTDNGGVLVYVTEGKALPGDWNGPGTGPDAGAELWFPYSRVQRSA